MKLLAPGARRLPTHHITIRVPWHDGGWAGSVCAQPLENTSCLVLPRIGEGKRNEVEAGCAGRRLHEVGPRELRLCAGQRVSFMAPFGLARTMRHPYAELSRHGSGCSPRSPAVPPGFARAAPGPPAGDASR